VQAPGQGCLVGLVQMAAFTVQGLLLLPLLALVGVGVAAWPPALAIACPVAVVYGLVLWRVGLDIGTRWLRGHQAELLVELSPRRAG
jgi:hypothetical protein